MYGIQKPKDHNTIKYIYIFTNDKAWARPAHSIKNMHIKAIAIGGCCCGISWRRAISTI